MNVREQGRIERTNMRARVTQISRTQGERQPKPRHEVNISPLYGLDYQEMVSPRLCMYNKTHVAPYAKQLINGSM